MPRVNSIAELEKLREEIRSKGVLIGLVLPFAMGLLARLVAARELVKPSRQN